MNYCSACGAGVSLEIPSGDNRERHVCARCGVIHYQNPKMVAGCLVEWQDQVLLCRRAIEPRYGLWTLPAGFMENGETTAEAALRETWEEATADVDMGSLYSLINIPHISQVYLIFRATLRSLDFAAGSETLEVALFAESDVPWDELAFPAVSKTLQWYFRDRSTGIFGTHTGDIVRERLT